MKEINILIDSDGNIELTTEGFQGSECRDETRELEWSLGKKTGDQPTREHYITKKAKANLYG
jgi:hypothetical protein